MTLYKNFEEKTLSFSQIIRDFSLLKNKPHAKALGQHFLTDPRILKRIVESAGNLEDYIVIEIGPGPGGLTREILRHTPYRLIAIEKDKCCIESLQSLTAQFPSQLVLIHGDAVHIDFCEFRRQYPSKLIKIIANLPYNVGTIILLNLLKNLQNIESLTLMFQKEVADRILASCNTPNYGRLSVLTQYLTRGEKIMTLAPGAFTPPPKVYSSVIRLFPRDKIDETLVDKLSLVTKTVFQSKRKMLRKSLLNLWKKEELENILENLGIQEERRPETLSIEEFVELAKRMNVKRPCF